MRNAVTIHHIRKLPSDVMQAYAKNLDDSLAVRCIRCGYDLRGQEANGRCPECGLLAHWSLIAPAALSQYPPGWVSTMAWATRILTLSYLAAATIIFLSPLYGTSTHELIAERALLVTAAVSCAGTWLLSRSSGHWSEPRAWAVRWIMRAGSIGPFVVFAAIIVLERGGYNPRLELLAVFAFFVATLVPAMVFLRLRMVARMIANPALAEHSGIVGWGFMIVFFALPLAWYFATGFVLIRNRANSVMIAIFIVGGTLFLLWATCIFAWCVVDFDRAARIARAQWKADSPAV